MLFETSISKIQKKINDVDPYAYQKSRNYADGKVSKLSPYISRGCLTTKSVFEKILQLELPWYKIEKFVQELAWRDHWQLTWKNKGNLIESDLKKEQTDVEHHELPFSIVNHNTGIQSIDNSIKNLYKDGYMHNHMRMYIASVSCNVGKAHWLKPAKWMYYHLLDGDLGSNYLSWQWVAGTNSSKKYYANQDNINKFFYSQQKNTFLDSSYECLIENKTPQTLKRTKSFDLTTKLSKSEDIIEIKDSAIYNYYNLDHQWKNSENLQRILLLEPSFFSKNPVSNKCIDFAIELSKNINEIKVFIGEFHELKKTLGNVKIYYKEHPTNEHYQGIKENRDWLFYDNGDFKSFFSFWKKTIKNIKQ